jgi:hypothetical protein
MTKPVRLCIIDSFLTFAVIMVYLLPTLCVIGVIYLGVLYLDRAQNACIDAIDRNDANLKEKIIDCFVIVRWLQALLDMLDNWGIYTIDPNCIIV